MFAVLAVDKILETARKKFLSPLIDTRKESLCTEYAAQAQAKLAKADNDGLIAVGSAVGFCVATGVGWLPCIAGSGGAFIGHFPRDGAHDPRAYAIPL